MILNPRSLTINPHILHGFAASVFVRDFLDFKVTAAAQSAQDEKWGVL